MKKIILSMLMLAMVLNGAVVSAASSSRTFKDISKHWAKAQIEQAVAKGYVTGYPNGTFKPDAPVTRAQFITMLVRALGLDYGPEGSTWYTTYVKAAKEAAIYQGDADFAEWNMNKEISREHMAWLAVRAADESLVTVESSGVQREVYTNRIPATATGNLVVRTDEFMREYYEGFLVHSAFDRGILNGYGGNVIGLDRTTTRAQAVSVIERVLMLRSGQKLVSDKYATAEAEMAWLKTNVFTMAPQIFNDPKGDGMRKYFKPESLVFQNNVIHTEIKRIILIDLDDPKDPYRKLLPATKKLGFRGGNVGKVPSDAYVMYVEYETLSNKNPKQYWGDLSFSTSSYINTDSWTQLSSPNYLYIDDSNYSFVNNPPNNSIGNGVTAIVIPNSGYKLYRNTDEKGRNTNAADRMLALDMYVEPIGGRERIINTIFAGTTTHHED